MWNNRIFIAGLLLLAGCPLLAQSRQITGQVLDDSLRKPLPFANISFVPVEEGATLRFAMTDQQGRFRFKASGAAGLRMTTTYLGYQSTSITLPAGTEDTTLQITLRLQPFDLAMVEVKDRAPPVVVRGDTVTYQADAFREVFDWKLQDLLRRLPGMEVDEQNRLRFNGEVVQQVMVEGKPFFGGSSRLALEHIPAEVIAKLEVIDNYNAVDFLQPLGTGNQLVLNVRLREDKKRFVFGDIAAAAGPEKRYLAHPNLFYYSPEVSVNGIGDLNNANLEPLSFSDVIQMQGGMGRLLAEGQAGLSGLQQDFMPYLSPGNNRSGRSQFGGLNVSAAPLPDWTVYAYGLGLRSVQGYRSLSRNAFWQQDGAPPVTENRESERDTERATSNGKLSMVYDPKEDYYLSQESDLQVGMAEDVSTLLSQTVQTGRDLFTEEHNDFQNHSHTLEAHHKFSGHHIGTLEASWQQRRAENGLGLQSNQPLLQGLIGSPPEPNAGPSHQGQTRLSALSTAYRHYWVLNPQNHFEFQLGYRQLHSRAQTMDNWSAGNGTPVLLPIDTTRFGNGQKLRLEDASARLSYKYTRDALEGELGTTVHRMQWRIRDEGQAAARQREWLALPFAKATTTWTNVGEFELGYRISRLFPETEAWLSRATITGFNQLEQGSPDLRNSLSHIWNLAYRRRDFFTQRNWYLQLSYALRSLALQQRISGTGIDQLRETFLLRDAGHEWSFRGRMSQKGDRLEWSVNFRGRQSAFRQILYGVDSRVAEWQAFANSEIRWEISKAAALRLAYSRSQRWVRQQGSSQARFDQDELSLSWEVLPLENLQVKGAAALHGFRRAGQSYDFYNEVSLDARYQFDGGRWALTLQGTNLLNNRSVLSSQVTPFSFREYEVFQFPMVLLVGVVRRL